MKNLQLEPNIRNILAEPKRHRLEVRVHHGHDVLLLHLAIIVMFIVRFMFLVMFMFTIIIIIRPKPARPSGIVGPRYRSSGYLFGVF